MSATNYTFTFAAGTLTVGTATITITADNQNRAYGQADPTFTYQTSGLVGADALTANPSCTVTPDVNAGTYPITCHGASASANYAIGYVSGTLTVTKATLTR